jgi:hypothetical protein
MCSMDYEKQGITRRARTLPLLLAPPPSTNYVRVSRVYWNTWQERSLKTSVLLRFFV